MCAASGATLTVRLRAMESSRDDLSQARTDAQATVPYPEPALGPEWRKFMERRAIVAFALGEGHPEYFQALRERDLFTDKDALEEQEMLAAEQEHLTAGQEYLTTDMVPDGEGGVAFSIGLNVPKHKEAAINAAIKSLGDRSGDDVGSISADLSAALKERGYWIEAPYIADMAASLAAGEDLIVGVDSGPERPEHSERAW